MIPADHSHAPWRKSILIPFWTIQLGLEVIFIGLLSIAVGFLVHANNNYKDQFSDDDEEAIGKAGKVIGPIWIALVSGCFILTITEIVLLARKNLKPLTFLITNLIKSTFWAVLFIMDIVAVVKDDTTTRAAETISLLIEAALLLSFWIPLIYASIIYHRFRTGKQYAAVNNPHANPYNSGAGAQIRGIEFTQYSNTPAAAHPMPEPYKGYSQQSTSDVEALQLQQGSRRGSYNHQRDPRFEEYRRTSGGDLGIGMAGTGAASPPVPSVLVQHHDGGAYEMEAGARRDLR